MELKDNWGHDRPVIEVTPAMIAAGVAVLRESGALYCASSSDDLLVAEVLDAAVLAAGYSGGLP